MMMLMMCVKQHFIYQSQKYKHAAWIIFYADILWNKLFKKKKLVQLIITYFFTSISFRLNKSQEWTQKQLESEPEEDEEEEEEENYLRPAKNER
jgi:hypothetical protein